MPDVVSSVTQSELSVHFRATYTSASLNEKFKALPRGVVRGFRLLSTGTDTWNLVTDTLLGESVMNAVGIGASFLYSVTYRTTTPVTIDLTSGAIANGRYYLAFVPQYTTSAVTTGEWRSYSEGEFENGDIVTAGGVFVGSIQKTGASPLATNILFAGESFGGTPTLFMREDMDNFRGDQGTFERALLVDMTPEPWVSQWSVQSGPLPAFTTSEIHNGGGSLAITATSTGIVGNARPVWQDSTALTTEETATVVVQAWFKTDGSYNATSAIELVFRDGAGGTSVASTENAGGRVPSYKAIPNSVQATWKLLRYEMKIPTTNSSFSINAATVEVQVSSTVTAGTLYLGRVQAWITHRPSSVAGDYSRSFDSSIRNQLVMAPSSAVRFALATATGPSFRMSHTATELTFDAEQTSGTILYRFRQTGGAACQLAVEGDSTDNSYIQMTGGNIRTDGHLRANQLRTNTGTTVTIRDSGGGDTTLLDVDKVGIDELRIRAVGPDNLTVRDNAGTDNITMQSSIFEASGRLLSNSIRAVSGTDIFFADNAGSDVTLDAHTGALTRLRPRSGNTISVVDSGANDDGGLIVGRLDLRDAEGQWGTGATPAADVLYRGNMPIAWGHARVDPVNTVAFHGDVFGVDVVTIFSATAIQVSFQTNIEPGNVNYTVLATSDDSSYTWSVGTLATTTFILGVAHADGTTAVNIQTTDAPVGVYFVVFGRNS